MRIKVSLEKTKEDFLIFKSQERVEYLNVKKIGNVHHIYYDKSCEGYKEGSEILIIKPGEYITCKDLKYPWHLELNTKGYILTNPVYNPEILGYFVEGNTFLLATTMGSAVRGILHKVKPSYDELEDFLFNSGVSKKSLYKSEGESFIASIGGIWKETGDCQLINIVTDGIITDLNKQRKPDIRKSIKVDNFTFVIMYRKCRRDKDGISVIIDKVVYNNVHKKEAIIKIKENTLKLLDINKNSNIFNK